MNNCTETREMISGILQKKVDNKKSLNNIKTSNQKTVNTGIDKDQLQMDIDLEKFKQAHHVSYCCLVEHTIKKCNSNEQLKVTVFSEPKLTHNISNNSSLGSIDRNGIFCRSYGHFGFFGQIAIL